MQTRCPECLSILTLEAPGATPDAPVPCGECGRTVRPGAFACPGCGAGLQVNHALLPPEGARGRCPSCREEIRVPSLASGGSPVEAAGPSDAAGLEEEMDAGATMRMDAGAIPTGEEDVVTLEEESAGEDAGATMRVEPDSLAADDDVVLEEGPAGEETDAGATMRLDPGTLRTGEGTDEDEVMLVEDEPADPIAGGSSLSHDDVVVLEEEPAGEADAGATMRLDPTAVPTAAAGPGPGGGAIDSGPAPGTGADDATRSEPEGRPGPGGEDSGATQRLDAAALSALEQSSPPPEPAPPQPDPSPPPAPPSPVKPAAEAEAVPLAGATPSRPSPPSRPPRKPTGATRAPVPPPVRRGDRGKAALLGLLLGVLVLGAGAYLVAFLEVWPFPPFPFPLPGGLELPEEMAWSILLGVAGAVVGALLGSLLGGSSRR